VIRCAPNLNDRRAQCLALVVLPAVSYHIFMTPWIFIAIAVLLLGATLRMWLEYGQRQRQLTAELHRLGSLIEAHTKRAESIRSVTSNLEQETNTHIARRDELQAQVMADRAKLTALEERLERTRPKSHRIDNNPREGKDDW
jgi:hypothetical protein